ncbi:serine/threonine-protein kinase [Antricoccus suffuscus]|uniref:non-specific serine/threonine protein kinase n=2 Tax=Antricoccus suffuscus TaxID=1629062 RepID=A0A2T0ZYF4_9ACTN|nr:serine/threonine-protein kinase [Antricoccus suffuscus]
MVGVVLDGRYRVLRRLATGGMSKVYIGHDDRLDRAVAIKIMNADLAGDPAFIHRFTREARAAARIWHPNVVTIHDQGTDQTHNAVFLVMELVRGGTLREILRAHGTLKPAEALTVVEALLTGLGAAHREGLVHRDIKPENILIDDEGRLLVADFGLARAVAESAHTTHSGMGGAVFGTIAYLSPEQVVRGYADARSDVYAVGVLLYELLTGRPPYVGDNAVSVAYRHVNDDVPPPSEEVPDLPGEVDDLVIEATNRDPLKRPVDAQQMLAQVRRARLLLGFEDTPMPTPPVPEALTGPIFDAAGAPTEDADLTDTAPGTHGPGHTALIGSEVLPVGSAALPATVAAPPSRDAPANADGRPVRRRRRRMFVAVSILAVVLLLAGGAFWWFQYGRWTKVPDFAKATSSKQVSAIAQDAGVTLDLQDSQFSESVAEGGVLTVQPKSGTRLVRGSDVKVVLSKGPERYTTSSDLLGKSPDDVVAQLKAEFGGRITIVQDKQYDDTHPAGTVSNFDPPPGTEMKPGSTLTVITSLGKSPIPIVDVTGKTPDEATKALTGLGFVPTVSDTQEFSDTVPAGMVTRTDPVAGAQTQPGAPVTIYVSKGQDLVAVPSVIGMTSAKATETLQAAGFAVQKTTVFISLDLVAKQDPSGGAKAKRGSTVTISVV